MNYKKHFIFIVLIVLLGLGACEQPAPGLITPTPPPTSSGGTIKEVATDPNANYYEIRDGEHIDADFNGSISEMAYSVQHNQNQPLHGIGQYVVDNGHFLVAPASSHPSYPDCKAVTNWHPSHKVSVGDYFCYQTSDEGNNTKNYGYIHIVKLQLETDSSGKETWTMGFNYFVWGP